MSNPEAVSDVPEVHAIGTESRNKDFTQPLYEKIRGLENTLTNGFLSQFEQSWADRRQLAEMATKALDGDRAAQQALGDSVARYAAESMQTLRDFTQPETWQQLALDKMQDIQTIRQAYRQEDYDAAAKLTGIAIAGIIDLDRKKSHHDAPTTREDNHPARDATNSDQDFSLSENETIQIGHRTFTHEDEVEHVLIRAPLRDEDIAAIDDHDPLAPRRKHATRSQETSGNSTLANIGIGGVVAAGLGVAGYEAHQHLSHGDRQHNLELSVAYKATMQLVENQSNENRKAFYDISLGKHPELQEAFAGYEKVRASLTKDGALNDHEKVILDMVVYNTNLNILDGRIANIRANSPEFSDPGHERAYYEEKSAPSR